MSVTLSVATTQTSGVAPLGVVFDATATTSTTDAEAKIHSNVLYEWYIDEHPENVERRGPVIAYVFEGAGTHKVVCKATDSAGDTDTTTITITVDDPDASNSVYAGTNTVCVSSSSNFNGAPTGANLIVDSDWTNQIRTHAGTNKRILFRRGDTFESFSDASVVVTGPMTIGAYGSPSTADSHGIYGNDPILKWSGSSGGRPIKLGACTDLRIEHLIMSVVNAGTTRGVAGDGVQTRTLISKCKIDGFSFCVKYGVNTAVAAHNGVIVSSCNLISNGKHALAIEAKQSGFVSSTFQMKATGGEHVVRMKHLDKCVFFGNTFDNDLTNATKSPLKIHNAVPRSTSGYEDFTQYVCVMENTFECGAANWAMTVMPQNQRENEHLRRILIEGNRFNLVGQLIAIKTTGEDFKVRNNVFDDRATTSNNSLTCVDFDKFGVNSQTVQGQECDNNTYYGDTNRTSGVSMCHVIGSHSGNALVRNNLVYHESVNTQAKTGSGTATEATNRVTSDGDPTFSNKSGGDFHLADGSNAIDAGTTLASVREDFDKIRRPQNASYDVGAYESGDYLPDVAPSPPP